MDRSESLVRAGGRHKLAIWSPLPPAPSGVADYVAETLPLLSRQVELSLVVENPADVAPALGRDYALRRPDETGSADLHLYHLGNSPSHAYVYRAAIAQPGVAFLHDWSLHDLVLRETVGQGDRATYMREMRRAYGDVGSFVGRQVAQALGGTVLPALYPLNERVLETSLGIVGMTEFICSRAAERLPPDWPVLHLPHHVSLPILPPPTRDEARAKLGLPRDALIMIAPGLATASKRLDIAMRVVARLRARHPSLQLVVAGALDPALPLQEWARAAGIEDALLMTGPLSLEDFVRYLCAADVVWLLRFPSHGEMSGALLRALGVGRPALVTSGTPAAQEFPEGLVVPVDPGRDEEPQLCALLERLLDDSALRDRIGRMAAEHVQERHSLPRTVAALLGFLDQVILRKEECLRKIAARAVPAGSLLEYLTSEVRWCAHELGLGGYHLDLEPLLSEMAGGSRERP